MVRQTYQIEVGDRTYEITANDDAEAQTIADYISERVEAGDPTLQGAPPPLNASVHAAPESSALGSAGRGALSGAYFNWDDELTSFGNALGLAGIDNLWPGEQGQQAFWNNPQGFWQAFEENMRRLEEQRQTDEAQHPVATNVGRIAGAVGSTIALPFGRVGSAVGSAATRVVPQAITTAAGRAAIPLAARASAAAINAPLRVAAARGAGIGGGVGAASAAGEGRGNRAQSGAIGLLGGAALGTAADTTITALAPAIRRYASVIFGSAVPREEAMTQVVQSLMRDGYNMSSPAAVQLLRQELSRFTGRPVSLADIGHATRARTGVGLRAPSGAQNQSIDQVIARTQGQGDRLSRDIRQNVAPRTDVHALDEQLVAQRAQEAEELRRRALFEGGEAPPPAEAAPSNPPGRNIEDMQELWRQAQATEPGLAYDDFVRRYVTENPNAPPMPSLSTAAPAPATTAAPAVPTTSTAGMQNRVVDDPILHAIVRTPDARRALSAAVARSRSELELAQAQGLPTEHLGAGIFDENQIQELLESGGALDMRTLDALKRFLDDEVSSLFSRGDTQTFTAGQAHQVRALRDAIRDRMRTAVPEYGDYLDAYSASSDMIEALRAGRGRVGGEPGTDLGFDRLDPERIAADQAGRSEAAQEFYRVGAARRLEDIVMNTGDANNPASRILANPRDRERLEALGLQPGAAERLGTAVQQERQLNLLPRELSGAQTAQRLAAERDADTGIGNLFPFNPMSGYGWGGAFLRGIANRASTQRNAAVNQELLPMVLETNPQAVDSIINDLVARGQLLQAERVARAQRARSTSRTLGSLIGSPVALPIGD